MTGMETASLDGNRGSPGLFQDPGKFDAVAAPHIPAPAELGGHGDVHGFHHGLDDFPCQFRGTHQSRAVAVVDNLAHWTAHIDIQHIRAGKFDSNPGGLGHTIRLMTENLHSSGMLTRELLQKPEGFPITVAKRFGGNQLRAGIAGPQLRADLTESSVGNASHRSQGQL